MILPATVRTLLVISSVLNSYTRSLAIVVKSSFTKTFLSPVLGFLVLYDGCSSLYSNECCDNGPTFCSCFNALMVTHSKVRF